MPAENHNYLDLDSILASQEKIPCEFEIAIPHLGYIDPSLDSEDIPKGFQIDLPYWLVLSLVRSRQRIVKMHLPHVYSVPYRDMMEADPCVVDLRKLCTYFYYVGSNLIALRRFDDSLDIAHSLLQTFQIRLIRIMDTAQNTAATSSSAKVSSGSVMGEVGISCRLELVERDLYARGQRAISSVNRWLAENDSSRVVISEMISGYRKRKRQDSDEENDDA